MQAYKDKCLILALKESILSVDLSLTGISFRNRGAAAEKARSP